MRKQRALRTAALLSLLALLAAGALALAGCGTDNASASGDDKDLVAQAAGNGDISQFSAALKSTGLDKTLAGDGPFTVFAPSDAALKKAGVTLDADTLKAQIIEGQQLLKTDLAKGTKNGSMLADNDVVTYTGIDGSLYMDSIKVVAGPLQASNGVVYVIDGVVTPK